MFEGVGEIAEAIEVDAWWLVFHDPCGVGEGFGATAVFGVDEQALEALGSGVWIDGEGGVEVAEETVVVALGGGAGAEIVEHAENGGARGGGCPCVAIREFAG